MQKNLEPLLNTIKKHQNSEISEVIDSRMDEFSKFLEKSSNEIYKELCFCFMTANFNASKSIEIQKKIDDGFLNLSEQKLAQNLTEMGHRFPNMRAKFIFESRHLKDNLKDTLVNIGDQIKMREWIVKNVKGIGMKEASHFLRNIGYNDVAIIDFHIVDLLARHGLIEKPKNKSISPKKYIEIENVLREISEKTGISLGELDLYLWYEETGTVLK